MNIDDYDWEEEKEVLYDGESIIRDHVVIHDGELLITHIPNLHTLATR